MRTKVKSLMSYSMNEVESMYNRGLIGQTLFEAYCRVWDWITFRFGGVTGWKHEQFWKAHGKTKYLRRINRTRAAFGLDLYTLDA